MNKSLYISAHFKLFSFFFRYFGLTLNSYLFSGYNVGVAQQHCVCVSPCLCDVCCGVNTVLCCNYPTALQHRTHHLVSVSRCCQWALMCVWARITHTHAANMFLTRSSLRQMCVFNAVLIWPLYTKAHLPSPPHTHTPTHSQKPSIWGVSVPIWLPAFLSSSCPPGLFNGSGSLFKQPPKWTGGAN